MKYEMKELIPLVTILSRQYTSKESSSICEEKAKQLMEAVLYTIDLTEDTKLDMMINLRQKDSIVAKEAYFAGGEILLMKFQNLQKKYGKLMEEFDSYGNVCLKEMVEKGFPAFFRYYDITYNPQNTILTLDYPMLGSTVSLCGILAIEQAVNAIETEQLFLQLFSREYVIQTLTSYHNNYEHLILNVAEVVYESLLLKLKSCVPDEIQKEAQKSKTSYCNFMKKMKENLENNLKNQNSNECNDTAEKMDMVFAYLNLCFDGICIRNFYKNEK